MKFSVLSGVKVSDVSMMKHNRSGVLSELRVLVRYLLLYLDSSMPCHGNIFISLNE